MSLFLIINETKNSKRETPVFLVISGSTGGDSPKFPVIMGVKGQPGLPEVLSQTKQNRNKKGNGDL